MGLIAVTGATGQLGGLIVSGLLDAGVEPDDIVAVVRNPATAAHFAQRGVQVRTGDYTKPDELGPALAGVDVLMLVSSSEVGQRVPQHKAVIDAARSAEVGRIVYTSVLRADSTQLMVAPEHKATEALIRESGLAFTFLRNGWYTENYTAQLGTFLSRGTIVAAAGSTRVAAATRADYAAAAVSVLIGSGDDGAVYELGGTPFTMSELATAITAVTGTAVAYVDLDGATLLRTLHDSGVPDATAGFLAALSEATARGDLDTDPSVLSRLIGRPSTPLGDAIRAAAAV